MNCRRRAGAQSLNCEVQGSVAAVDHEAVAGLLGDGVHAFGGEIRVDVGFGGGEGELARALCDAHIRDVFTLQHGQLVEYVWTFRVDVRLTPNRTGPGDITGSGAVGTGCILGLALDSGLRQVPVVQGARPRRVGRPDSGVDYGHHRCP